MATVQKRTWLSRGPTGHKVRKVAWGYTLQVDGKQERKYSAEWSREDAQTALDTRRVGRASPPVPSPPAPKTFDQVATEYLEFKRGKGKRSVSGDELHLRKLRGAFGDELPVTEITAHRIAQYDRQRAAETSRLGRKVAPATLNRELATLRHLLRLAEEWGYIGKAPRIRMAKEPEGRLRFLSEEEAVRLLEACRTSQNPFLHAIVTLALHTGMRRGEMLGLTWERVDFARGVIRLEETKSGRRREVPMNRAVYDVLTALTGQKEEGFVFRRRDGGPWGRVRTAFARACVVAELEAFRFHDLRHTCASWLVMRGRNLKEVQELLGHREFKMTLRYAHLSPDRLRDAVASLEDFSTKSAHDAKIEPARAVSPRRAVSSVGRAPDF